MKEDFKNLVLQKLWWAADLLSTLTVRVLIPLKPTVSLHNLSFKRTKINKNRPGLANLKNKLHSRGRGDGLRVNIQPSTSTIPVQVFPILLGPVLIYSTRIEKNKLIEKIVGVGPFKI